MVCTHLLAPCIVEAKFEGLALADKTPGPRENCYMYTPCLIQNLPAQLALDSFCFQNLDAQMGCGYDNRGQRKEEREREKKSHDSQSLLHLPLYTSDIAN